MEKAASVMSKFKQQLSNSQAAQFAQHTRNLLFGLDWRLGETKQCKAKQCK
jgi:hypothetical protein